MKKLIWEEDVDEIDLGDGDYVSVTSALSVKDMAAISGATTQVETSMLMLHMLIKSWRGPSFEHNGEKVPVTPENIDRLDMRTATILSNEIAQRVNGQGMDDGEKKDSTSSSSDI